MAVSFLAGFDAYGASEPYHLKIERFKSDALLGPIDEFGIQLPRYYNEIGAVQAWLDANIKVTLPGTNRIYARLDDLVLFKLRWEGRITECPKWIDIEIDSPHYTTRLFKTGAHRRS